MRRFISERDTSAALERGPYNKAIAEFCVRGVQIIFNLSERCLCCSRPPSQRSSAEIFPSLVADTVER